MDSKQEIRQAIRSLKKQIGDAERRKQSDAVCLTVQRNLHWQQAKTVMLYHALPDELDTRLLLESDKRIVLPVVEGDELKLKEYRGNALRQGALGILEPDSEQYFDQFEAIDVVIVPGVAFTSHGKRLGRGRGYYDRFLPRVPQAYKIGICYQQQLIADIPTDSYDQRMDLVISFQTQDQS